MIRSPVVLSVSLLAASLAAAAPAHADVVTATPAGFEIKQSITVDAPIATTWDTLRSPQKWWSKEHTYSDDAANLYLDTQATGCFCERLPGDARGGGGSVEHARIVYIAPGRIRSRQRSTKCWQLNCSA